METVILRRFQKGDEFAVSDVICATLAISNRKEYSPAFIEESYLTSIFVLPDYQGKGVGGKIVETLEAKAARCRRAALYLPGERLGNVLCERRFLDSWG